ncbi:FAD-dependent oxidoreductase [Paracandidimonas soli]|uniref:NADPH-dependent 2,4-dienoyl-CoA reductase/sulfur reductase-like enzyme n=1 Tax=Paracandidimonas soli TaxID=1917182 RepID=A0A4V2VSK7_9BURK|nr:FAD/NAD(P)-binding oxidoreductase [Paracandidimonas soli]TCV02800.1 NADPH-dependent 2,4-dienoyl-CoA reductase/sulfur reductase-like enzyme [Paracandidimonas soli]
MDRRHFLLVPPSLALGSLALPSTSLSASIAIHSKTQLLARSGKGPRIVICGGGWGGMTSARYLRKLIPDAEVVLLERNPTFWSGPMSNKWLIDIVDTDFLNHDMLSPANKYGYTLINTEVTAIERDKKTVRTTHGAIDYDYLILSGGIRNAYEAWFGNDVRAAEYTRQHFPNAYIPNAEMFALKNKLKSFKGGTIVMTLPPPPHRCPPSPYERACLMAWHIKTNKIPGKIIILDPKPKIAPIGEGYKAAFEELYPDIITHVPNAKVTEVDPFNKRIKTAAGDFDFDDAVLMPPHQAADMVWYADLIGTGADGKPTGWADIHPRLFTARADEDVYVVGDSMGFISDQFGHYPKSAHVAHAVAKIVAQNIAERVAGKDVVPVLPDNLCYMMVNGDPQEEISVVFEYELDANGKVLQTQIDMDVRTADLVKEDFAWIESRFNDFL